MQDLLFNTPWWLPTGIAALGVILFITGNSRVEPKIRLAGVGVVALAILLAVVSYLVDTPKEKCESRTRQIVNAVSARDWVKFGSLVDAHTSFDLSEDEGKIPAAHPANSGPALTLIAEQAANNVELKSVNILVLDTKQDESLITISFSAISVQGKSQDQPVKSSWQFSWQQRGNDWFLQQITCLGVGK